MEQQTEIPGVGLYDNDLPLHEQTEAAQLYISGLIESQTPATRQTEHCGYGPFGVVRRPTELLYRDLDKGVTVEVYPVYAAPANDANCFAERGRNYVVRKEAANASA